MSTQGPSCLERGFSLMEAIVATVIAALAVMGLAHTFGLGHGLIDNYATSRAALGEAQRRMEWLGTLLASSESLQVNGLHPGAPAAFSVPDVITGTYQWSVADYDDPATATPNDMKQVTLFIAYRLGADPDTVRLTRLFQKYP